MTSKVQMMQAARSVVGLISVQIVPPKTLSYRQLDLMILENGVVS